MQMWLLLLFVIIFGYGCSTMPNNCCYMTPIPDGYECASGQNAYVDCEGNGTYNGQTEYCERWRNCSKLVAINAQ